jgi:hypothetical protein
MLTFCFDIFFQLVIFNDATEGDNYGNMEKVDTKFLMNVGRIRVIFLNRFVNDLLVRSAFIDPVLVLPVETKLSLFIVNC